MPNHNTLKLCQQLTTPNKVINSRQHVTSCTQHLPAFLRVNVRPPLETDEDYEWRTEGGGFGGSKPPTPPPPEIPKALQNRAKLNLI